MENKTESDPPSSESAQPAAETSTANSEPTLIPVYLNEAAVDSPSFRATTVFFAQKVEQIESWLDSFVRSSSRFHSEINGLDAATSELISKFQSETIIDHDARFAWTKLKDPVKDLWKGFAEFESILIEPLTNFQRTELRLFKEYRRSFDAAQQKYDAVVHRYCSQSKSKEPSALREEAFQLYEARKNYIHASFELCTAAPQLRASLDRLVSKITIGLWKSRVDMNARWGGVIKRYESDMEKLKEWGDNVESAEKIVTKSLLSIRSQLEEKAKANSKPVRELEEYASSTVPYLSTHAAKNEDSTDGASEKQGWLFVKTTVGSSKAAKNVWVRKWFFVKDGVFGSLVPSSGGVEEGEKIGVLLLSNIKPAFQEERRFCFEVKTKSTSLVLQTETQQDLLSWIQVFQAAKLKSLDNPIASSPAFVVSPSITTNEDDSAPAERSADVLMPGSTVPLMRASVETTRRPQMFEDPYFSSTHSSRIVQKLDRKYTQVLSTLEQKSASGKSEAPAGGIQALISSLHRAPTSILPQAPIETDTWNRLSPLTLASPPMPTSSTNDTLIAFTKQPGFSGSGPDATTIPGTLMANHWGSTHWCHDTDGISRNAVPTDDDPQHPAEGSEHSAPIRTGHRKAASVDMGAVISQPSALEQSAEYLPGYPTELVGHDAQFRILFPGVSKREHVALIFTASWNVNEAQEFPGRCYVTTRKNIYFYSNMLGFVLTKRVGSITDITFVQKENELNVLLLSMNEGERMVLKVFLSDPKLLYKRLKRLVDISSNTESATEIIQQISKIGVSHDSDEESSEGWEDLGQVSTYIPTEKPATVTSTSLAKPPRRSGKLGIRAQQEIIRSSPLQAPVDVEDKTRSTTIQCKASLGFIWTGGLWIINPFFAFIFTYRTILLILVASASLNLYLLKHTTSGFIDTYQTNRFISGIIEPSSVMSRSIRSDYYSGLGSAYVKDSNQSECSLKFNDMSRSNNRLQRSKQRFSMYRHDLLVALKLLDSLEHELHIAHWQQWLFLEVKRCEYFNAASKGQSTAAGKWSVLSDNTEKRRRVSQYCLSCKQELRSWTKTLDKNGNFMDEYL